MDVIITMPYIPNQGIIPNPITINIQHINRTMFPPNPTLDKTLTTLFSCMFEGLIHDIPTTQYTSSSNKFKLLGTIIANHSESLILNSTNQAYMLKISNKHDKIAKAALTNLIIFLIITPPKFIAFVFGCCIGIMG